MFETSNPQHIRHLIFEKYAINLFYISLNLSILPPLKISSPPPAPHLFTSKPTLQATIHSNTKSTLKEYCAVSRQFENIRDRFNYVLSCNNCWGPRTLFFQTPRTCNHLYARIFGKRPRHTPIKNNSLQRCTRRLRKNNFTAIVKNDF
jgi:hypothetical protein